MADKPNWAGYPIEQQQTKAVELKFQPSDIHDIDFFGHGPADYQFLGSVPLPDGQTLALQFPRGANPVTDGVYSKEFVKKWYWVWAKYDMIVDVLTSKFKWKNLPEEIDPQLMEQKIQKEGRVAIVKIEDKYCFADFDVVAKDFYDQPLEIEIRVPSEEYDKKLFKEGEFAVIRNNPQSRSLYYESIQYLEFLYQIIIEQYSNLYTSKPKGIFLNKAFTEENGYLKPIETSLNAVANGSKTFFTLNLADEELNNAFQPEQQRIYGKNSNPLYLPIEFTDRTDNLIKMLEKQTDLLNERVGIEVKLGFEKKERLVSAEIETNNAAGSGVLQMKKDTRKYDAKKVNKVFGLNIGLEEDEEPKIEKTGGEDYGTTNITSSDN